ncbi:nickel ABC transporter ATP-binding protein NikE [Telmatospirillum siberiense]|uniref:ABC transporter ATP-binding protein n=1 Tax=Telmatospirillum siberiense TaxID=382514 RepID=A0A2N3PT38_9PROT|nr:ABC transporter ATP-binding protein [Telmatospirillum siberiense]PKU23569.1 ABC transporter ATP-binding protein [Telmatospirillum siberiense]
MSCPIPIRSSSRSTPATAPLVAIEGLTIRFRADGPHRPAVQDMDLVIHPGECVALVGESGSGKSVTARSLLNLVGPGAAVTARRFEIDGADARNFGPADWQRLRGTFAGLVMQDALVSLDPLRTIGREVGEVVRHHRLLRTPAEIRDRVIRTLDRVGMPDPDVRASQYAHQLSGGLRQRALIAAAIAGGPRLIIADEPTTALDASVQKQVLEVLRQRVGEGAGLLLISHDLAVVADLADRVLVMRDGRVLDAGPTGGVLARPRHAYTRQLIAAVPSADSRGSRLSSSRLETAGGPTGNSVIVRDPLPPRPPIGIDTVLEARGLTKVYRYPGRAGDAGRLAALADVSFSIRSGEVLGLVGESGSGKSTCAKILLGLVEPDAGWVTLLGQPWSGISEKTRRPLRRSLQYIPQDPLSSFDPRYRVADIIGENLLSLPRSRRQDRIVALLDRVGLDAGYLKRPPLSLSGGQRQRVAVARALAARPALIVCDEPVSALDISIQAQVIDLIAELQSELETALLFISHDIGLVHHLADRVLVLNGGRVVEQGPVEKVFLTPTQDYTRTLLAARPGPLTDRLGPPSPARRE